MEINQENIEKVIAVLRMGRFNEQLLKVTNISKLAEQLIEQNPGLTPEEIGQVYDQQMELEAAQEMDQKQGEEGPSIED